MSQCTLCGSTAHNTPACKWRNTCATCAHFNARSKSPEGLIGCKADRRAYAYKSPTFARVCAKRAPVDSAVAAKRVAWIEGRA